MSNSVAPDVRSKENKGGGKVTEFSEGFIARVARGLGYIATGKPQDWFGPLDPMTPQAPPEVAGRQFDYPSGYNLVQRPRAYEGTGFAELRALADAYDLIRAIIETRKDQMERLSWSIRRRDFAAVGAGGPGASGTAGDPRVKDITNFLARPDGTHWWPTWLRMILEDLLVIDAPALYLRRNLEGKLCALEPLDGATVKRVIDDYGRTPQPPAPAYQQILKGLPAVDYTTEELLYFPRNVRVHKVYGYSPVEQVQMTVNIALRRQIYQLQYYTEGNVPEALIGVPESWNPDQIRQFQAYWDSLLEGNLAERRHAKFVPGGVAKTFVPVREPALKDPFDEWLARVVCFAFSVSPQPFVQQMNRATAQTAQDNALAEGLLPLQNWVKQLADHVILTEFQAPDLEFAWAEDNAADPETAAAIATDYVKCGIKTVNEARGELGLGPVPGGDQPVIITPQGPVPLGGVGNSGAAKLQRFNPSHYGPGPQGGQFAPSDGGGEGGDAGSGDPAAIPVSSVKTPLTYDAAAKLVHENNLSDQPDELILAVMYKESSFDTSVHTSPIVQAMGLMQVTPGALTDVLNNPAYRGFFPSDRSQIDLNDPATNIQAGSAYIQIRTNVYDGDLERALSQYSGHSGATSDYASEILAATRALQQTPANPISTLESIVHPPKKPKS